MRMTVEQDVIFPNVPEKNLEAMQQEPMFQRLVTPLWVCITPKTSPQCRNVLSLSPNVSIFRFPE